MIRMVLLQRSIEANHCSPENCHTPNCAVLQCLDVGVSHVEDVLSFQKSEYGLWNRRFWQSLTHFQRAGAVCMGLVAQSSNALHLLLASSQPPSDMERTTFWGTAFMMTNSCSHQQGGKKMYQAVRFPDCQARRLTAGLVVGCTEAFITAKVLASKVLLGGG